MSNELAKNILLDEANRCLLCKNPKCKKYCPINTPIPEIIELYKNGEIEEAGRRLFDNNPLSAVCSIVCIHEDQCSGNCIRGIKSEPIMFYEIEKEISLKYLEEMKTDKILTKEDRIAIIGGGPAGIAVAFILAKRGYNITIFDANERIGGVLRYGIPQYRLDKAIVNTIENKLLEFGVKIRPNTVIGPVITLDKLFEDGYKAAFIGTGVWSPKALNIKGETLGHVHYAIDYLKSPETYNLGDNVLVIGAGNVAMDAAGTAKRSGAKNVTIVYRKDVESMPATKHEIAQVEKDGVEFKLFRAPVEITDKGLVTSITKKVVSEDEKISWETLKDEEDFIPCDSIVIAVSQAPKKNIVSNTEGLDINKWGLLITDDKGNTTKKGTFACGDVVTGAKTVVEAVAQAKSVADTIDEYCQNN